MEKGFVENGFIINLSDVKNTAQLVFELSSIMEHPDVKGKNVCLKIGSLDLKQSQLLSIKALIESMDANIAFIDTDSEQTEASAVSLGIIVSEIEDDIEPAVQCSSEEIQEETVEVKTEEVKTEEADNDEIEILDQISLSDEIQDNSEKTVEVHADISTNLHPIETTEGVEDVYEEETAQELSEIIPSENFNSDFESLASNEGLIKTEELSKYILLDTGDVLQDGALENKINTESLPTLYINQTLRSGQTVSYEGNIFIIGDAHPGSEIVATGDISVWGILGGIAHAGAQGNVTAKVRALKLNAIQLRISGLYARRNDTLNVPYVQKTNEFTPEEAQIENGKIVIYKKLRRD